VVSGSQRTALLYSVHAAFVDYIFPPQDGQLDRLQAIFRPLCMVMVRNRYRVSVNRVTVRMGTVNNACRVYRRLISSDHAPCFYLTALHDFISGS